MTKFLLPLCLTALLCGSPSAHAALGVSTRQIQTTGPDRADASPARAESPRRPGPAWYLGVGFASLFALKRLRRLGLERHQRETETLQTQARDANT